MPTIYKLFGFPVMDQSDIAEKARKSAICPFMDSRCDGGGNRNQTKINLTPAEPLRNYLDGDITTVIPGICSIIAGEDTWVVCPRRLFAARNASETIPTVNRSFQEYEREILLQTHLHRNQNIGIWSEVHIKQKNR